MCIRDRDKGLGEITTLHGRSPWLVEGRGLSGMKCGEI
jgi:hypothetical protein